MNKLTLTTLLASVGIVAGCAGQPDKPVNALDRPQIVTVKQDPGKFVYWVKPGPRINLSEEVFGTPDNPKRANVETYVEQTNLGPVKQLLRDLPVLVAAPEKGRRTNDAGTAYTAFGQPGPFGNNAQPLPMQSDLNGYFKARMVNNVETDQPGGPFSAADELEFEAEFHDPDGNHYRIDMQTLVQPPIPGYETGGGVVVDTELHGTTGTGTPLMPREYTHGAFWGFGDLYVNGEKRGTWMTHLIMLPVEPYKPMPALGPMLGLGPTAPRYAPVETAYELPNGKTQPFIHMMFEQDTITEAQNVSLKFLRDDEPGGS